LPSISTICSTEAELRFAARHQASLRVAGLLPHYFFTEGHHAHKEGGGICPAREIVLDEKPIPVAHALFASRRDGVLKIAITP
jgi:hypothetical protein